MRDEMSKTSIKIEADIFEIDRILNYSSSSITCDTNMQNLSANTNLCQLSQSSALSSFNFADTSLTASSQLFSEACSSPTIERKPLIFSPRHQAEDKQATTAIQKPMTQTTAPPLPPRFLSPVVSNQVSKILDKAFHTTPVSRKALARQAPSPPCQIRPQQQAPPLLQPPTQPPPLSQSQQKDKATIARRKARKPGRKCDSKTAPKQEAISKKEPITKSEGSFNRRSMCQVDFVVRNLLSKKQIKPGVNILRYRDPDGLLHRASLLPQGRVQANIDGGPIFTRLGLWVKYIIGEENRTSRAILDNELKRVKYSGRILSSYLPGFRGKLDPEKYPTLDPVD